MKAHLTDLLIYLFAFAMATYASYPEFDLVYISLFALLLIGIATVMWTILAILGHSLLWFWDNTVNYRKHNREMEYEE